MFVKALLEMHFTLGCITCNVTRHSSCCSEQPGRSQVEEFLQDVVWRQKVPVSFTTRAISPVSHVSPIVRANLPNRQKSVCEVGWLIFLAWTLSNGWGRCSRKIRQRSETWRLTAEQWRTGEKRQCCWTSSCVGHIPAGHSCRSRRTRWRELVQWEELARPSRTWNTLGSASIESLRQTSVCSKQSKYHTRNYLSLYQTRLPWLAIFPSLPAFDTFC